MNHMGLFNAYQFCFSTQKVIHILKLTKKLSNQLKNLIIYYFV